MAAASPAPPRRSRRRRRWRRSSSWWTASRRTTCTCGARTEAEEVRLGALDVLRDFYPLRLEYYHKRKALLLARLREQQVRLSNKVRFILEVVRGELVVSNRKRAELLAELQARKYDPIESAEKKKKREADEQRRRPPPGLPPQGEGGPRRRHAVGVRLLLSMPLWTLTFERVQELLNEKARNEKELAELEATPEAAMWEADLDAFLEAHDAYEREEHERGAKAPKPKAGAAKARKPAAKPRKPAAKKAGSDEESGSEEELDDGSDFEESAPKKKPAPKAPVRTAPETFRPPRPTPASRQEAAAAAAPALRWPAAVAAAARRRL
eukprot:tig00021433_g21255.t1